MFRFIKKCLIFSLILFSFLLVSLIHLELYDNIDKDCNLNENVQRLKEINQITGIDLLFLGNSHTYSGVNPIFFEKDSISVYNLGIATGGIDFFKLILEDYLKYTLIKPKTIMVLISPLHFSSQADNFLNYPIHRYLINPKSNIEIIINSHDYLNFIHFFNKTLYRSINNMRGKTIKSESQFPMYKGYLISYDYFNEKVFNDQMKFYLSLKKEKFDSNNVVKFKEFFQSLDSININIVLYNLPTNKLKQFFNRDFLTQYDQLILELKNDFFFIELDEQDFCESDFRNIDHLNFFGANKATSLLREKLKEKGILNSDFQNETGKN